MAEIDVKFMKGNKQTARAIGLKIKPDKKSAKKNTKKK